MTTKVVYVTGCLGFIGRYVAKACLDRGWHVMGIDNETYAADLGYLEKLRTYHNFKYLKKDINDINWLYDCDYIINTAAETHVDNSIVNSTEFIRSNIDGVYNLLRTIQTKSRFKMPTLLHFSTDEVYGDIMHGSHRETDLLTPSNPYSATKASADMLIMAWARTYNIPYVIIRPSNNYGVGQYVEKFIPKACKYLSLGKPVPIHEHGLPRRTWLHVKDTADAVLFLIDKDVQNEIFNISGNYEDSNINVFKKILKAANKDPEKIESYADFSVKRAGQDVRYSIDDSKIRSLGWNNMRLFDNEIKKIVKHHMKDFIW
jgi:dTDP-glucose 4,6-dehydratase